MATVSPSYEALQQQTLELSAALLALADGTARLRAEHRQCRSILDNIPGITYRCLKDRDYTTVFIGGAIPTLDRSMAVALISEAEAGFARIIHPDDLPMVRDTINRQLDQRGAYDLEYRLVMGGQEVCWVNDRGCVSRDESGEFPYLDGMLLDISARKKAEQALRESEARFRVLVDHSHDLISLLDDQGLVSYVSPSWTTHLGYPSSFWTGKSWRSLIHPEDLPLCEHYLEKVLAGRRGFAGPQYRVQHADGCWRWHEAAIEPVYDDQGQLTSLVAISRDIHDRKQREQQMLEMAYHDDLTGLANRALLMDHLALAIAQARRTAGRVAVALLDLDCFKEVNDELGHYVGDQLLKAVARRLDGLVRDSDTVARLGGDEFVLVLVDVGSADDLLTLAQKIVDSLAQPFEVEGHTIQITTSLGVAVYPDDATDADLLVRHADKAMYHAKRTGRNRVSTYPQTIDSIRS